MTKDDDYDLHPPTMEQVQAIVDAWPVLIRILNRRKVLNSEDRNDLRFATKRRRENALTFETQLERALEPSPAANDEKRQRRGGNQPS